MKNACCIRDGCGKPFDPTVPEKRGYLRAFWQRYCPEHRLAPEGQVIVTEVRATAKHAPGPWQAQNTAGYATHGQTAIYAEPSGRDIALVYDGEANALLISAAPELLDMLTLALPYVECAETDPAYKAGSVAKLTKQIRAAIAKAEGKD